MYEPPEAFLDTPYNRLVRLVRELKEQVDQVEARVAELEGDYDDDCGPDCGDGYDPDSKD
jgi:hypothetical protein